MGGWGEGARVKECFYKESKSEIFFWGGRGLGVRG